ncbi:MAG TPA: ABC transporter substrate-binding protein [Reyranella sp.]|jgi:ABC-type branched-subunit amino acid transport system substrate-binding protein|nr:ABC transporter substrate-binding protein [Reyranella sp.]
MKYSAVLVAVGALGVGTAFAQEPIKIGVLYPLTGGGAVYGVPAMAGHQLAVEELNAKGGIMGRKIESIERDDKLNPAAASSTMKELITKDKVDIVLGGLASSVGLAMSEVSKQEKVVYISTIPKTIQMTTDKLHKYVFRTASNTDLEGDTMALLVGKYKLAKLCHLELDYAYGNDLEVGILKALPKHAPDAKVVLTLKPKLGATDFNPFIPQVMSAGCDGVISGLWGPHFVSWVKQAAPLGFFDKIKWISGGEIGSHEIAGELKGEYPDNVISNTYELWYHGNDPSHAAFQARLAKKLSTQETPQWAMLGYIGVMYAAQAIEKAKSTEADKVAAALEGLTIGTPVGSLTIDAKTHQANIGQFWGPMVKKPDRAYRMMEPAEYIQPK